MILCSKYHANQKSFQKHHYNSYSNDNKCLFSSRWFVFAKVLHLRGTFVLRLYFRISNFLVHFLQILLGKNHKLHEKSPWRNKHAASRWALLTLLRAVFSVSWITKDWSQNIWMRKRCNNYSSSQFSRVILCIYPLVFLHCDLKCTE